MRSTTFCVLAAVLAAGCGSGGSGYKPVPVKPIDSAALSPESEKDLFPFAVGNQWTYEGETQQRIEGRTGTGRIELTFRISKVTPTAGGEIAEVEVTTSTNPNKKDLQRWERNAKGLFQTAVGNPMIPFTPAQPVLMFPVEPNRKFSWKGTGMTPVGKVGTNTLDGEILPVQEVFGVSERFSGIGVSTRGTFASGTSKGLVAASAFFAPKVGLVRYRQEVVIGGNVAVQTLALKAKTVR